MNKVFRNPLFYFSICASFALSSSSIASSKSLTEQECMLIQEYNNTSDISFTDHFAKMAHQMEFCMDVGAKCEVPLRKRMDDFHVVFRGQNSISSDAVSQVAEDSMGKVLTQFSEITNLTPKFEKPTGTDKFIYVVFVDSKTVEQDFDAYVEARIARDNFKNHKERARLFRYFIDNQRQCLGVVAIHDDSIIRDDHIWIRSDLGKETMQKCVSEEFYNSFGLDEGVEVDSIFDYTFSRTSGDYSLSEFDLLKLKVLYRDELRPGMTKVETRKTTDQLLLNECSKL